MCVGRHEIDMLNVRRKHAEGLDGIHAKQHAPFAQEFTNFLNVRTKTGHKMTGSNRHQPGIFIHLADHVAGADPSQLPDVEEAHFHAAIGQRHPGINIARVVVLVDEHILVAPETQPFRDETEGERRGPDERDFLRFGPDKVSGELA